MQYDQNLATQNRSESLLAAHSVLRNTYLLLSLTLMFSAASAGFAMATQASYGTSLMAVIAGFILLFVTSALRNSAWGILSTFAFTGCMGFSLGPLLNHFMTGYANGGQLIMTALAGTGLTFLATSGYVLVTKKELSGMGKFLMIGLVMSIVASLANLFFQLPALQLAIASALTVISALLMMYDTSRILHNGERNYIMATINLYLDIQILFQNLLILLGAFNNKD